MTILVQTGILAGGGSGGSGSDQNLWATITGDTGSTTADSLTDNLTIAGGTGISTSVSGDTLTITATGSSVQNKFDATTAPVATNDTNEGYSVGSVWVDITNDEAYRCVDATASAAVWINTTLEATEVSLSGLSDTNIISPSGGEILKYNISSGKWENGSETPASTPSLSALTDTTFTLVQKGDLLVADGVDSWVDLTVGTDGQVLTAASGQATGLQWATITQATGSELENVVEDTTPQLGGNLDVQSNSITTSTVNGNITLTPNGTGNVALGNFTFDADATVGAGQDDYVLTYDNATGTIGLEAAAGGASNNWLTANAGSDFTTAPIAGTGSISLGDDINDTGSNSVIISSESGAGVNSSGANNILILSDANGSPYNFNHATGRNIHIGSIDFNFWRDDKYFCTTVGNAIKGNSGPGEYYCTALGYGITVEEIGATAIGATAVAGDNGITYCTALGYAANAKGGAYATALGALASAQSANSVAIGRGASAPTSGLQIKVNNASTLNMSSAGAVSVTGADASYVLPSYTVATAPTGQAGAMAYFTDGNAGAACAAVHDGTNWKVVALGATISAT